MTPWFGASIDIYSNLLEQKASACPVGMKKKSGNSSSTRFASHPKNRKKARRAVKRLKTVAPGVFAQVERILGHVPKTCLGDRGYRGKSKIDNTRIHIPKPPRKNASKAMQDEMRKRCFQHRAAIEPVIAHLKSDHRPNHNFLKEFSDHQTNLLMAAAAFNFKKWMREVYFWLVSIRQVFSWVMSPSR